MDYGKQFSTRRIGSRPAHSPLQKQARVADSWVDDLIIGLDLAVVIVIAIGWFAFPGRISHTDAHSELRGTAEISGSGTGIGESGGDGLHGRIPDGERTDSQTPSPTPSPSGQANMVSRPSGGKQKPATANPRRNEPTPAKAVPKPAKSSPANGIGCRGTKKKVLGKIRCINELIETGKIWTRPKDPQYKIDLQTHASKISKGNRHFVATLGAENGAWTTGKHKKANGDGSWDWGLCGFNSRYNGKIIKDPRFKDPRWQVEQCYEKYRWGTTFYAYITPRWQKYFDSLVAS